MTNIQTKWVLYSADRALTYGIWPFCIHIQSSFFKRSGWTLQISDCCKLFFFFCWKIAANSYNGCSKHCKIGEFWSFMLKMEPKSQNFITQSMNNSNELYIQQNQMRFESCYYQYAPLGSKLIATIHFCIFAHENYIVAFLFCFFSIGWVWMLKWWWNFHFLLDRFECCNDGMV